MTGKDYYWKGSLMILFSACNPFKCVPYWSEYPFNDAHLPYWRGEGASIPPWSMYEHVRYRRARGEHTKIMNKRNSRETPFLYFHIIDSWLVRGWLALSCKIYRPLFPSHLSAHIVYTLSTLAQIYSHSPSLNNSAAREMLMVRKEAKFILYLFDYVKRHREEIVNSCDVNEFQCYRQAIVLPPPCYIYSDARGGLFTAHHRDNQRARKGQRYSVFSLDPARSQHVLQCVYGRIWIFPFQGRVERFDCCVYGLSSISRVAVAALVVRILTLLGWKVVVDERKCTSPLFPLLLLVLLFVGTRSREERISEGKSRNLTTHNFLNLTHVQDMCSGWCACRRLFCCSMTFGSEAAEKYTTHFASSLSARSLAFI